MELLQDELIENVAKRIFETHARHSYNKVMFKARYGVPIPVVVKLYKSLEWKVALLNLMLALNYLKIYPTWAMGVQGSGFSDKTYREIIYETILQLSQLPMVQLKIFLFQN